MPEISQNSTKEIDQYESEAESSTTRDVAQAAGLEAVTSSPKGAQTAIQDSSTVIGSSSTTGIGISENDDGRGAQSSTGILDSSAELDVQSSRVQGSLEGKNVEGHSADVQERGFTTSATAAVGGRVDPTVVSELEGGIQTGLSTEATGTAITSATAHQTEQERKFLQLGNGMLAESALQLSLVRRKRSPRGFLARIRNRSRGIATTAVVITRVRLCTATIGTSSAGLRIQSRHPCLLIRMKLLPRLSRL